VLLLFRTFVVPSEIDVGSADAAIHVCPTKFSEVSPNHLPGVSRLARTATPERLILEAMTWSMPPQSLGGEITRAETREILIGAFRV
jgi:hypothetical protein